MTRNSEIRSVTPPVKRQTGSAGRSRTKAGNSSSGTTTARRELVENEMFEQASKLFAERGFAGTNLQDIAEAMGISRPALYYYVKSKDELLAKLVTEITEGSATEINSVAVDESLDPPHKLRRIATMIATARAHQPTRFLLLERSEADLPPHLAKVHDAAKRATLRDLTRIIEQGVISGQFRPVHARSAALAVMGMCNWVAWWAHPNDDPTPDEIGREMSDLAVAMLAQTPDRTPTESGPHAAIALLRQDLEYLERILDDQCPTS